MFMIRRIKPMHNALANQFEFIVGIFPKYVIYLLVFSSSITQLDGSVSVNVKNKQASMFKEGSVILKQKHGCLTQFNTM